MAVVDEEVAPQRAGSEIVNAARAVGHVAHYGSVGARTELCENVRDHGCKHEESFGHLECDVFGTGGADAVDGLVDFEVVVAGEERDGGVDVGIFEDALRNGVEGTDGLGGG